MLKKIIISFLTIFIITTSFNYAKFTKDSLYFLKDPNISNSEKKEKLLNIITELREELRMLKEEIKKKEQINQNILLKTNNELKSDLKAKSYGVYLLSEDKKIKPLFLKNEKKSYSLASIVKLMTAVVAWEKLDHNKEIIITKKSLEEYGDNGLIVGEKFTLYDLMVFMITVSSNDAASAIASSTISRDKFIEYMNEKANKLDMKNTYFESETGLDHLDSATAWSSPDDIVKLLVYVYKKFPYLSKRSVNYRNVVESNKKIHKISNTNRLLKEYKNFRLSKTGYEISAGGNLATIYQIDEKHTIAIVILGSTVNGRFDDTEKIIKTTREYLKKIKK